MLGFLPWLYLLRVPLIFGFLLGGLAPFALMDGSPGHSLLEGLFDVPESGVFIATIAALFVATACTFSTWLVLRYGHLRFGVPGRAGWTSKGFVEIVPKFEVDRLGALFAVFYSVAALAVVWGIAVKVRPLRESSPWWEIAPALFFFLVLVLAARFLWIRVSPKGTRLIAALLVFTECGYLKRDDQGGLLLEDGHGFAISVALLSHAFYLLLGYRWLFPDLPSLRAPALVCVLLMMALLCWMLGALAFFFDGFRTPVLLPLTVLAVAAAQWPESDHFFEVKRLASEPAKAYPFDLLNASNKRKASDAAIVICASGGGIQAAAWTAKVLTALRADAGPEFTQSLRLISSVSGGSAGALQFLGAWTNGDVPENKLAPVFQAASDGVLDEIAQGLVYPDLWRVALPFFVPPQSDRGQAMEKFWAGRGFAFPALLSDWRAEAVAGTRPVVIFNATVVESGERLMLSTTDFERRDAKGGMRTFGELFADTGQQLDVSPVTAARLSATFPYVSPAARPNLALPPRARYHLVDGGYYDNWGVASAVDFLDQAVLQHPPLRVRRVLVIQIRDSLSSTKPKAANGSRGWFFQFFAPIKTLVTVRDSGQVSHDATELRILKQAAQADHKVDVQTVDFEYPSADTPLSWYLDRKQRDNIWMQWDKRYRDSPEICQVRQFLRLNQDERCKK